MRLRNTTDIPDELIRGLVRTLCPPSVRGYDVRISNTSGAGRGRAYTQGSGYHDRACPFIVVRVPRTDLAARNRWPKRGAYLAIDVGSRVEVLVVILAHELRHLWQAKTSRGRVYGARGRFSERDADAYALSALRRFRRGELLKEAIEKAEKPTVRGETDE